MTELAWVFLLFVLCIFVYYLTFAWLLPFLLSSGNELLCIFVYFLTFAWFLPFLFSSGNEFLCILGVLIALFAVIGIVIYLCDKFFGGY